MATLKMAADFEPDCAEYDLLSEEESNDDDEGFDRDIITISGH